MAFPAGGNRGPALAATRAAAILTAMPNPLLPPGPDDIQRLADEALRSLPTEFRRHITGLVIRIEEFPDQATLDDLDLDSPFDLLGLYHGIDLAHRGSGDVVQDVDMVLLYWRPILDYWIDSGEALDHVVRHVLIHEIGHHFGFSDDDMASIEESG